MTACVSTSTGKRTTKTQKDSSKIHTKNTNETVKLPIEGAEKQNWQVFSQRNVHVSQVNKD